MTDFSEIKIPSIEQCKFSNHGKRIGCEYGPARFASQKYGTEAEKRNEAYMMVCQSVQTWLDFFTSIQEKDSHDRL